ncbi:MAG: TIGR02099 family protein [Zoogloeaceae bacterium]|jgi:uncharacterized protein (TIGR02099 family)|nr:TIGR02099 family protein [Zoogloeaceae bacterium]
MQENSSLNPAPIPTPVSTPVSAPARFGRLPGRLLGWLPGWLRRTLVWLFWIGYFGFALIILSLRYAVLPNIEHYRADIESGISRAIGLPVSIDHIDTRWHGLRPQLSLRGLNIRDAAGRPALTLDTVETELSWASLWHGQLRLRRLEIDAPDLHIRREPGGRIFIAGLELDLDAPQSGLLDWLLAQERIVIRDAAIRWDDAQRAAPPLALSRVNAMLENDGRAHRFGLTAVPPPALAARLDVRGAFRSADPGRLETWTGQAYAELDYADLAVWRAWVDYPVDLPRGAGGMRLWLGFDAARLDALTADIALRDVKLRWSPDLPMIDLAHLAGRVSGRLSQRGFEVNTRRLTLATHDGAVLPPTDFSLRWTPANADQDGQPARGTLTADALDLGVLARLSGFLPLPAEMRQTLTDYAPSGRIADLKLGWTGEAGAPATSATPLAFDAKARFEGLGLSAQGRWPGFAGLSGSIEGNEKEGRVSLDSRRATLDLPRVFADPRLEFATLTGKASWTAAADGRVDVQLQELVFDNPDAAGNATGHYRSSLDGPGEIDLTAWLNRADGAAVWRYMPLAVSADVPAWLHGAITGGRASDAELRLQGDLKDFPFADGGKGIFRITAKIAGASLRYAQDWPGIDGIDGDLLFEGKRMRIRADKGRIYGVALSGVSAEIPDLEVFDEILVVNGQAAGPTADFLRFIETSPVLEQIDRFTDGMHAAGNGTLGLKLLLPLRRINDTKIEGHYQFLRNELKVDADLPPLTDVNGSLRFTGASIDVKEARAQLLGSPLTVNAALRGGGAVEINAQGSLNIAALRKSSSHRLLEHLSGSAAWRGTMQIKNRRADVKLESNLRGIASTLPAPFNKTADDVLPFTFERVTSATAGAAATAAAAVVRDRIRVGLGNRLAAQILRRQDGGRSVIERGAIGIGERPTLPEKGMALAVNAPALDIDFWRRLFAADGTGESGGSGGYPVTRISLRATELTAFERQFHDVRLRAALAGDAWQAQVASREATGDVTWRANDRGRLRARLKQLTLDEIPSESAQAEETPLRELPGLDIVAENFTLGERKLGRLELLATNADAVWKMERLALSSADGALVSDGVWAGGATQLNFKLDVADIGGMLGRLGYADAVKRGTAQLEGKVSWAGAPIRIDHASLDGTLKVEAARGQFNKLEPGVGRLLGVLSLQSLPRRLTLDFRDIFSEGFAFDKITGDAKLARGVMSTQNLQIQGPAAKIFMQGEVSIPAETQDLRVRVEPALSDAVAVGAMIANPAVGAAAWVAQKLLKDPLGKMFAFEYAVTGPWSDPKVEKLQQPVAENKEGMNP